MITIAPKVTIVFSTIFPPLNIDWKAMNNIKQITNVEIYIFIYLNIISAPKYLMKPMTLEINL